MPFKVKEHTGADFLSYFILSISISGIIYCMVVWDMFGLAELLNPYQYYKNIVVTALILTGITAVFMVYFNRIKRQQAAMGLLLPALISVFLIARFGPGIVTGKPYFDSYEKTKWLQQKSAKMMHGIVHHKILIGKTRLQAVDMLGKPDQATDNQLTWYDGNGVFYLELSFNNNQINTTKVQLIDP